MGNCTISFNTVRQRPIKYSRRGVGGDETPQAVIDHFCFTLSNWNEERVRAAMRAKGLEISGGRNGSLHVLDPSSNYDIQFANDFEENAFRRRG